RMITVLKTHPERLVFAVAAFSWGWMFWEAMAAKRLSCGGPHATATADLASWMVMIGAMMLPTTTSAVQDVAVRSYRFRRPCAVLEYILGYATCWMLLGAVFAFLRLYPFAHDLRTAAVLC